MKTLKRYIGVAAAAAAVVFGFALAQSMHAPSPSDPAGESPMTHGTTAHDPSQMPSMMQEHSQHMMQVQAMHGAPMASMGLASPGQDAFGAIQEVVRKLEADPKTDWSKVDLEALRQHLIDMDEVTLRASATTKQIEGGLAITVTGTGRTLAAIHHMVPAHAHEINGYNGWSCKTEALPEGELWIVTAGDGRQVERIRALGFIGILVSGEHHQPHHLAIAKGEMVHGR
ncbi:MAG TPA: hypothetical protein VKG21_22405 [Casimicrobiaceae bacterium]|nr:hypothetical protein [Casimicrobiaceae bacterium]